MYLNMMKHPQMHTDRHTHTHEKKRSKILWLSVSFVQIHLVSFVGRKTISLFAATQIFITIYLDVKRKKNDEWMEKNKTKAMESDSQLIGWSLKRALKTHLGGKRTKPWDFDKWHRYENVNEHLSLVYGFRSDWHIRCLSWVWIITACLIINKNFLFTFWLISWALKPERIISKREKKTVHFIERVYLANV